MSYSASALSFMLENLKVILLVQLPIEICVPDAKENLITAIQIASLQENGCHYKCVYILNINYIRGNRLR
jgi:L-asparaginase